MVNKQTKKDLKKLLKECKEKPYLFPLYPLSALGFIIYNGTEKKFNYGSHI